MHRECALVSLSLGLLSACAPLPAPQGRSAPGVVAETPPRDWHLLDATRDHYPGISAERAYREIIRNKPPARPIVVAMIDVGVDTLHPSLRSVLWTNSREIPGNGIDDDHNGYVDDVHGWDFVGGPDGRSIEWSNLEVTRLYNACKDASKAAALSLTPSNCLSIRANYLSGNDDARKNLSAAIAVGDTLAAETAILERVLNTDSLTRPRVEALQTSDSAVRIARDTWLRFVDRGLTEDADAEWKQEAENIVRFWFDTTFDGFAIIRDHPDDAWEHNYGNNDVNGPRPVHGTHTSGIVAGLPDSGVSGIARGVRIMMVRATCMCDERDKDIANAIRYAVDNGANIISMSFGKDYSPQKLVVDSAVKYADSKGVLLVHAAGNSAADIDTVAAYPLPRYLNGQTTNNWIEVGASSWKWGDNLIANFSNYGNDRVDVFAPGVAIFSTLPGGHYGRDNGTSMSAPVVAGIAAVLMQYYPELSAADVKRIILASAVRYNGERVLKPGTKDDRVTFDQLSRTGGIANLYTALRLAERETGRPLN